MSVKTGPFVKYFKNHTVFLLFTLFMALFFAAHPTMPGALRTVNAPDAFQTERAFNRLERILGNEAPHPVDSPANDLVRQRIQHEIEQLGYTPLIRNDRVCNSQSSGYASCARVKNIVFSNAPNPTTLPNLIMVSAHYDSVPAGPGAADDGIGVASLLEIAAHVKSMPEAPILFVMTDGEEMGLFGAKSFLETDPLAASVKYIVNMEARGVRGPAFMFETSVPNGDVMKSFAKIARRPTANSIMTDVYERLPNSTDVAVYLPAGYKALNYAIIHGLNFYHTPGDNLARLDKRSLQHMGDNALAIVRQLAAGPETNVSSVIFTDILSYGFVILPRIIGLPGLILITLSFIVYIAATPLRRDYKTLFIPLAALVISGLLGMCLHMIITALRPGIAYWQGYIAATQAWTILTALFSVGLTAYGLGQKENVDPVIIQISCWLWFTLFGILIAVVLPGSSIFFLLPALPAFIGIILAKTCPRLSFIMGVIGAGVALGLWGPIMATIGHALGYGMAPALILLMTIVLWPVLPYLSRNTPSRYHLALPAGTLMTAFLFACILPAHSKNAPQALNFIHYSQAGQDDGLILSRTDEPLPAIIKNNRDISAPQKIDPAISRKYISFPATKPVQSAPSLNVVSDIKTNGKRHVTLSITAKEANRVDIYIPRTAQPSVIKLGRNTIKWNTVSREYALLRCHGVSCDGTQIEVTLDQDRPHEWIIHGIHYNFADQSLLSQKPSHTIAYQNGDLTLISAKQRL